jgi:HAD superfamily phosphatase
MDGVLVDVSQSYRKAIQGTVEFFTEKRLSMERIQEYKNKLRINNDWKLSQKIIESLGKNVPLKAVVQKFQELYLGKSFDGLILNESWLFEKKLLKKLAEKNEICILTGRPKEEALFALRRFGVKGFFKTVISMDDLPKEKQKPDPFGLLQLRKKFGTTENYYFGDTLSDIACAKAAGFFGVGVLPPQDKSNGLSKKMLWEGAIAVLKDINEIEEAIK